MDTQKKDNLLFSTEQSQMVAAKKTPSTLSVTSNDKPEDTVTMSKDDFKTLMDFVRYVQICKKKMYCCHNLYILFFSSLNKSITMCDVSVVSYLPSH